jgi:hypothetical protein
MYRYDRTGCEVSIVAVAAAAYDAAGATATLTANMVAQPPPAGVAAAWAGAAVQAQEAWLLAALARALRGKCQPGTVVFCI